jgi:hypothetical protein
MIWIVVRSVRITSITLTEKLSSMEISASYLSAHGLHVTRICFRASMSLEWQSSALKTVCALCPNVMEIIIPQGFPVIDGAESSQTQPDQPQNRFMNCLECLAIIATGFRRLCTLTFKDYCVQPRGCDHWVTFFECVNPGLLHISSVTPVSNEALQIMAARCRQLQSLEGDFPLLTDDLLSAIVDACPDLSVLCALHSQRLTQQGLAKLLERCKKLATLGTTVWLGASLTLSSSLRNLKLCITETPSEVVRAVGNFCPQLRELTIISTSAGGRHCDPKALLALARGCPQLRSLSLSVRATDALLAVLGRYCRELSSLLFDIAATNAVTNAGLYELARGCPQLQTFRCTLSLPVTMVGVTALATHCRLLRRLDVTESVCDNACVINRLKVCIKGHPMHPFMRVET